MGTTTGEITELLRAWSEGDPEALDRAFPRIMDEVRALARKALSLESRDITLQPTELINEAYLRLVNRKTYPWRNRVEFFGTLATLMRRILVDRARRRHAAKRGGGAKDLTLDEGIFSSPPDDPRLLALSDALDALEEAEAELFDILMLNLFVGLKQDEIAREIGKSVNTVARRLKTAKAWIRHEMEFGGEDPPSTESA